MTFNPGIATIKAARAAEVQRKANQRHVTETLRLVQLAGLAEPPRLRTGRRTQQAIDALQSLRRDISIGLPAAALIDRIDDELFKLKR